MQFGIYTVGERVPDRKGKVHVSYAERLRTMTEMGILADKLGLDVYAVGEHHNPPFVHSSPTATLGYLAAATQNITLSTATSLITTTDPVRLAEDFAQLQYYAPGRVDLILGRGAVPQVYTWFGKNKNNAQAIAREGHQLLRELWTRENITWKGRHRAKLQDFTSIPRPLDGEPPFIWHGGMRDLDIADQAAEFGEGFFHNHIFQLPELARDVVAHYREKYEEHGHGRAQDAIVGLGGHVFAAETSAKARELYRPYYEKNAGPDAWDFDEYADKTPMTVGTVDEIVEKVLGYRDYIGDYQRQLFLVDGAGLPHEMAMEQVEILGTEIVPRLRKEFDARRAPGVPSDPPKSLPLAQG